MRAPYNPCGVTGVGRGTVRQRGVRVVVVRQGIGRIIVLVPVRQARRGSGQRNSSPDPCHTLRPLILRLSFPWLPLSSPTRAIASLLPIPISYLPTSILHLPSPFSLNPGDARHRIPTFEIFPNNCQKTRVSVMRAVVHRLQSLE